MVIGKISRCSAPPASTCACRLRFPERLGDEMLEDDTEVDCDSLMTDPDRRRAVGQRADVEDVVVRGRSLQSNTNGCDADACA